MLEVSFLADGACFFPDSEPMRCLRRAPVTQLRSALMEALAPTEQAQSLCSGYREVSAEKGTWYIFCLVTPA